MVGRKTREVLALLALAAPRPITAAGLADRLWDDPPPSAIKTVQAHVSRARTALAAAGGARLESGYRIVAGPAGLDVLAVEDLRRRARVAGLAGHDHDAAGWLAEARRRWRGEPELPATHAGDAERARLAEEHLLLVEDHLAAEVAAGRPARRAARAAGADRRPPAARAALGPRDHGALPVRAAGRRGRGVPGGAPSPARRGRDGARPAAASAGGGGSAAHPPGHRAARAAARPRSRSTGRTTPTRADGTSRGASTAPVPSTCCCSTRRSCPSTPTARRRTWRTPSDGWRRGVGWWRSTGAGWACPTRSRRRRRRAWPSGRPTPSPCWTRAAPAASTCWPTPTPG